MKEKKGLPIFLRILKITVITVVLLTLVIFFIGMIDAFADKNALPENPPSGTVQIDPVPLYFVLALVLSLYPMIPCLLLSLTGLIISFFYKSSPKKTKNRVTFLILSLYPFLYYAILFITGLLLGIVS